jgi:hypothetical protein
VSVSANKELYKKLKEEFDMCQALQELMKDEIDEKVNVNVDSATERLNKLNAILMDAERYDDLKRSTKDKDFQNKLLDELVPKVANS